MLTSNKILLGFLLVVLIIPALIFGTLKAMIKNGKAISENYHLTAKYKTVGFHGTFRYVKAYDLGNVNFFPGDSTWMEVNKSEEKGIQWILKEDTLIFKADSGINEIKNGMPSPMNFYGTVNIYLPNNIDSIYLYDCEAAVYGAADSTKAARFNFSLSESYLLDRNTGDHVLDSMYYDRLSIKAINSGVLLPAIVICKELDVKLENANLTTQRYETYGKITIDADDNSSVKLEGKHLKIATVTPKK